MKKSFAQILDSIDRDRSRKVARKLPSWSTTSGLEYPTGISLEQCSSEPAALYKAALLQSEGTRTESIADLTGGLGVDSWAFSKVFGKVYYNEMNEDLSAAADRNFSLLGCSNILTSSDEAESFLDRAGHFDWIYLDPARRNVAGRKVFLLEDCSPNVMELLPKLFGHTDNILLKLSPMADISMIAGRFGERLKEIHVTGLDGECKELLCILTSAENGKYPVTVAELGRGTISFTESSPAGLTGTIDVGDILYEPGAALLKSGYADRFCSDHGLSKLDRFTHLYSAENTDSQISVFGKTFEIIEVADFSKAGIKHVGERFPEADVTSRNLPVSSEELKKRLHSKPGNGIHIFGAKVNGSGKLIVCRKIS